MTAMKRNEAVQYRAKRKFIGMCLAASLVFASCAKTGASKESLVKTQTCPVELIVLGIGQDAGAPQIGNPNDPAWADPSKRLWATSLALIDHENGKRYLFEGTPDIREQIQYLDEHFPVENKQGLGIDGIFLTHAHIGHYAGLMFLGRESAGTNGVPVYVMPRMKEYLEANGPWSQLVELGNIEPVSILEGFGSEGNELKIIAKEIEHRDEFSETVLYEISTRGKKVVFVPDIDDWNGAFQPSVKYYSKDHNWSKGVALFQALGLEGKPVDYAFLDATFYDDNELPGRDMSQIPHPRVTESMDLIDAAADETLKDKVRFIHINHTNPLRDKTSEAYKTVTKRGYKVAKRGERFCL